MTTGVATEKTDPDKFADFLVQYAENPEGDINALSARCGLSKEVGGKIVNRLRSRYMPVVQEVGKVTTKALLKKIDTALPLILDKLADEELIEKSPIGELSRAAGILVEKRQLLRGEPTQIMSFDERKSMKELTPALIAEMEKRAIAVDVEYEDIPPEGPIEPAIVSKTAKYKARREDRGRV